MISQLEGKITAKRERFIILDVHGVGYRVHISSETKKRLSPDDAPVRLWTHLAVREDALELFGFHDAEELEFFELLIGISGVGPKSALAILSLAPPETLRKAINAGDNAYLTKVAGIGRKTAEKILLELRDKIGAIEEVGLREDLEREADALEALRSLGYSIRESREVLRQIPETISDTGDRIKEALKLLGK